METHCHLRRIQSVGIALLKGKNSNATVAQMLRPASSWSRRSKKRTGASCLAHKLACNRQSTKIPRPSSEFVSAGVFTSTDEYMYSHLPAASRQAIRPRPSVAPRTYIPLYASEKNADQSEVGAPFPCESANFQRGVVYSTRHESYSKRTPVARKRHSRAQPRAIGNAYHAPQTRKQQ